MLLKLYRSLFTLNMVVDNVLSAVKYYGSQRGHKNLIFIAVFLTGGRSRSKKTDLIRFMAKKHCISLDWLQISCKVAEKDLLQKELSKNGTFKLISKDIKHNIFAKHIEIHGNAGNEFECVAVFSYQPLSGILPEDIGHLKIINKQLYQSDLIRLVNTILIELSLKFHAVSRLDIAFDFKKFQYSTVPQFFKGVSSGKILKRRVTGLHLDGRTTRNLNIHYMRFGSRSSEFLFYVYNKSKELRDKTMKPYIKDKWKEYKINDEHSDTYRIEFVLHPSKNGLVDTATGQLIQFTNLKLILSPEFQTNLFWTLFQTHFVFLKNDGQIKKCRMKTVNLLNVSPTENIYIRVSEKTTSNRTDKMLIKKMYQLSQSWREQKENITLLDAIKYEIENKDLYKWAEDKSIIKIEKQETETEECYENNFFI